MKDGTFREDLYYRLAVIPVEIPPLRERLEDVPLLVNHFLQKQASATGGEAKKIDPKAVDILCHYDYPGNVRELENAIERACALCDEDIILPTDLPPAIVEHAAGDKARKPSRQCLSGRRSTSSSRRRSAATSTRPWRTQAAPAKRRRACSASAWRRSIAR
jgi:DNA-binding NtrC family response regulator